MNFVAQAAQLNKEGVSLLGVGDGKKAMDVLQQAIATMKLAVDVLGDEDDSMTNATTMTTKIGPATAATSPLTTERHHQCFCESPFYLLGLQSDEMHVYNRVLMFDESVMNGAANCTMGTLPLYLAVLIFNQAVASHHTGKLHGREMLLRRSTILYEKTLEMLGHCRKDVNATTATHAAATDTLALLALNNKAMVYYDEGNYKEFTSSLGGLTRQLKTIVGQGGKNLLGIAGSISGFDQIVLNTMVLRPPISALAA